MIYSWYHTVSCIETAQTIFIQIRIITAHRGVRYINNFCIENCYVASTQRHRASALLVYFWVKKIGIYNIVTGHYGSAQKNKTHEIQVIKTVSIFNTIRVPEHYANGKKASR